MKKAWKQLIVLALAVCMLWGMTATALAADGETSTFSFTNEGAESSGTTGGSGDDGGTTGTPSGTTGSGSGTGSGYNGSGSGGSGSGSSGSTSGAKTADVNTGAYATTAAIAGAGVAALLGVSLNRKRRYGKEER